jgi:mannose-1-phosphate guanylyltransferase/mannose-6-phosphate isomerase
VYVVVMAGGGGTRLRPLSTEERPKPFLPLLPTGETLLQRTIRRLQGDELGAVDVAVVALAAYAPLVAEQLPGVRVINEPEGRNTAPAITLATLTADREGRDENEVMVVLPADHRMDPEREGVFRGVVRDAAEGIATGAFGIESPLVTLGVQVTRPATEYGYLIPDAPRGTQIHGLDAFPLLAFEEKPRPARAEALQRTPGVAWNAGMFLWRRRAIRAALERYAPDVVERVATGLARDDLAAAYAAIDGRSIDYAVMEPAAAAGTVAMAALDAGWTDVGTWPALLDVLGAPGIEGGVVEAGEPIEATADDLLVERSGDGRLVIGVGAGGTIRARQPTAVLRGACVARPIVERLLDRCPAAENRS